MTTLQLIAGSVLGLSFAAVLYAALKGIDREGDRPMTTDEKCHRCQQSATHWRRYEMPQHDVVHEFYLPYCDDCATKSCSASSAPRVPLNEVMREGGTSR